MDRAEKRRIEREQYKLEKTNLKDDESNRVWYSQLSVNRKIFISKFIERRTIENDNLVAAIMDKCILGSIDDNTSIDSKLMKKVVNDCDGYILDYKEYLDKNGEGGFDMIEDKKLRDEVKNIMISNINDGISKVKCMAWCKKEFKLPAAELSDMWVKCKGEITSEMCKAIENITSPEIDINLLAKEHMLEYISKGETKEACIGMIKNEFKFEISEILDLWSKCMKQPEPINSIKNNLKVISEVKVIKGQFGYYHKSSDGLRFSNDIKLVNNDIIYSSKDEVVNKRIDEMEVYNTRINKINEDLKRLNDEREYKMNTYSELEQVFDM